MSDTVFRPGAVDILTVNIENGAGNSISIKELFIEISLFEDLNSPHLSGNISVSDSIGLLQSLPVIGEEKLYLEYRTAGFTTETVKKIFKVYSIEERASDNSKSVYIINFVSPEVEISENSRLSRAFSGYSHEIIAKLLSGEGLVTDKPLKLEESSNQIKFISNFWSPFECIEYCTAKATNAKAASPTFLFYETVAGYNFKSLNSLMDYTLDINYLDSIGRTYTYDNSTDRTNGTIDPKKQLLKILEIYPNVQFNTLKRIKYGSYANRVIEVDTLKKIYVDRKYDYWDNFESSNHLGDHPAASQYGDVFGAKTHVRPIFTHSYDGLTHDSSAVINNNRIPLLSQLEFISYDIEIFGRTDLSAGDLLNLNLNSFASVLSEDKNKSNFDRLLSGRWIITSLHHRFSPTEHLITARVCKDSFNESVY